MLGHALAGSAGPPAASWHFSADSQMLCCCAGAKVKQQESELPDQKAGMKGQDSGNFSFAADPVADDAEEAPSTAPQPAWQPSPAQAADEELADADGAQVGRLHQVSRVKADAL